MRVRGVRCLVLNSLPWKAAVQVPPAAAVLAIAHEPTELVQPLRAPLDLVARDEFDRGVPAVAVLLMAQQLQPEPLDAILAQRPVRAGIRVPAGAQVGLVAQHESGVARAHQLLGAGRLLAAIEVATTALLVLAE